MVDSERVERKEKTLATPVLGIYRLVGEKYHILRKQPENWQIHVSMNLTSLTSSRCLALLEKEEKENE